MKIGFIGTGKLGLPCAQVMQELHEVEAYDIKPNLNNGLKYVELLDVIKDKDIVFIAVPTPHDEEYEGDTPTSHLPPKDFDYTYVIDVLEDIHEHIQKKTTLVLISTVLPGTIREQFTDYLKGIDFVYNPYLIAMGTVKWDFKNPEMIIMGTKNGKKHPKLEKFYKGLCNKPRFEVGTWEDAECIKIFYNTYISMKLAFTNMVMEVTDKLGNSNPDLICGAMAKSNLRLMGPKYMKPGLGDAGGCVLPSFEVNVNGNKIRIDELYSKFNLDETFIVDSTKYSCSMKDQKKIAEVTYREYDGDIFTFKTNVGEITVTGDHLIPVNRNGKRIIIQAKDILNTDKLYRL